MADNKGYSIAFRATDGVSSRIEAINKRLREMQAPVEKLNRRMSELAKRSGLAELGAKVSDLAGRAVRLTASLLRVVPVLGTITGAASLAGMYRLVSDWARFGLEVGQAAHRLDMSAPKLAAYRGAAELAGGSVAGMTAGLQGMSQALYDAAGGRNAQAIVMYNTLGVAYKNAAGEALNVADVLPKVADRIAAMKDPKDRVFAIEQLGGTPDMLPLVERGAAGMKRLQDMAAKYLGVTKESEEAAKQFSADMAALDEATQGFGTAISTAVAPIIGPYLTQLADLIAANKDVIATKIAEYVKQLAEYLKRVDWKSIGQDAKAFAGDVNDVIQYIGGWQTAAEGLLAFMVGKWATGMIASIVGVLRFWALVPFSGASMAAVQLLLTPGDTDKNSTANGFWPGWKPDMHGDTDPRYREPYSAPPEYPAETFGRMWGRTMPTWLGGDPAASPAISAAQQRANELESFRFWRGHGKSDAQAAGLVANEHFESGGDPGNVGDGGQARGILQWHQDRRDAILAGTGIDVAKDLDHSDQLKAAFWELTHPEKAAGDAIGSATSAYAAGVIGSTALERPNDPYGQKAVERGQWANDNLLRLRSEAAKAAAPPLAISPGAMMSGGGVNSAPPGGTAEIKLHISGNTAGVKTSARTSGDLFPRPVQVVTAMPSYSTA